MFKGSPHKWLLVLVCLLTAISISGQDLGSSNKLFGGKKAPAKTPAKTTPAKNTRSTPSKATAKKPTPKPKAKTTPAKANTTAKKPPAKKPASATTRPATPTSKTAAETGRFRDFKDTSEAKVEIGPARTATTPTASDAALDDRFEQLIVRGNGARDDRNYTAAEAAYKAARTLKPKDPRSTYGLGNLYSDQQRWEEAENFYRASLQIDQSNLNSHIALSYVLTQPIPVPDLSARYEEAEKLARRAIQLAPAYALAYDQLGVALELRGLIGNETENAYRKAIQLNPSFAPAYAHLSRLLRKRGLLTEAAEASANAVKRSTSVGSMILVAEILQSEQRYQESEKLLRSALAGDAKNPAAMLLLARALIADSRYDEAEKILRSSLDAEQNGFVANSMLATLHLRQENLEMAENALLQALRFVSPLEKRSLSQQFEAVGDGYLKAGNSQNAERTYRQAISLDAENQGLVGKLARAQRG